MKYDYNRAMIDDIKEWILNNGALNSDRSFDDQVEWLNDKLWAVDSITGNGPRGYASEKWCEEYVAHNLKLFFEVMEDWDMPVISRKQYPLLFQSPAKYMDTTIRCHLLYGCVTEALKELNYKPKEA